MRRTEIVDPSRYRPDRDAYLAWQEAAMAESREGIPGPGPEEQRADLEGVRRTREDVGALPVPRSVLEDRNRKASPRPGRPPPRRSPAPASEREREARLRRTLPHAARTPEELGDALRHIGPGRRDPQAGHEAGPPLPGERGVEGDH